VRATDRRRRQIGRSEKKSEEEKSETSGWPPKSRARQTRLSLKILGKAAGECEIKYETEYEKTNETKLILKTLRRPRERFSITMAR